VVVYCLLINHAHLLVVVCSLFFTTGRCPVLLLTAPLGSFFLVDDVGVLWWFIVY